jgi:hypothetical protein
VYSWLDRHVTTQTRPSDTTYEGDPLVKGVNAVGAAVSDTLGRIATFVRHAAVRETPSMPTPSKELYPREDAMPTGTPTTAGAVADESARRNARAASFEQVCHCSLVKKSLLALMLVLAEKSIGMVTTHIKQPIIAQALMWPVFSTRVATVLLFVALVSGKVPRPYAVLAFLAAHVVMLIVTDVTMTATPKLPTASLQRNHSARSMCKLTENPGGFSLDPYSLVSLSGHSTQPADAIVHNALKCLPHVGRMPPTHLVASMASHGAQALVTVVVSVVVRHTASIAGRTRLTTRGLTTTAGRFISRLVCWYDRDSTLSSIASTLMLAFTIRLIMTSVLSYQSAMVTALETAGVWALGQTGLLAQMVVLFITHASYRHLPGSILARTPAL